MKQQARSNDLSRRGVIGAMGATALFAPAIVRAQTAATATPATVITNPPRDFSVPSVYGRDPDIITIDPAFDALTQGNTPIQRLWTGSLWAEGPAWSSVGRYLVWSDIPNNRQLRWLEDDGRVSVFRMPSNNSNGNTFDFQGRQISCEHLTRRVVRYELDGSATVLADSYNGKRLNSPNATAASGSPIRRSAASSTRARPTWRAGRATPPAG
jgi:gluconolactonase